MNVHFRTYKEERAWRSVLSFFGFEAELYLSPSQSSIFWGLTDYQTFTAMGQFCAFMERGYPNWTHVTREKPWPRGKA